jgi:spermidine/putrescine transport system ATP-binding protein
MNKGNQMAEAGISCLGVSKRYKGADHLALQPSDLQIAQGEFFSLLGPSGSGKTTLLRMIAGFEVPTSGRIFLDGKDVTSVPANRRDINTVFQNYALFPHMTIAENVGYPLSVRGTGDADIRRRVADVLEKVEMSGFEQRLPHELSGGQRQRIALARALIGRPKVLLLDEPLGALDLRLRQQMQLVLVHLQKEVGITFIYVTHDQGEALSMSDRMAVLDRGRILQIDTPRAIYRRPRSRFVATFLGSSNFIEGRLEGGRFTAEGGGLVMPSMSAERSGPVAIAVRAEDIGIRPAGSAAPDGGRTSLRGRVSDVMFLGDGTKFWVTVGPLELKVLDHGRRSASIGTGDEVDLDLEAADAVILDD